MKRGVGLFLFFICLFAIVYGEKLETLRSKSFKTALKKNNFLFIMFFAPYW
jgi:hypothetical protein